MWQRAILRVQSSVTTPFQEDVMANVEPTQELYEVDPMNCPTCRSGFQPTEPPYDDAIEP
jgi:hypothetical protein